jgi:hypothetical protein
LRIVSFLDEKLLRALLQVDVYFLGFDAPEHFVHFQSTMRNNSGLPSE